MTILNSRLVAIWVVIGAAIMINGCAPSKSGNVYTHDQTMRAQTVQNGTVESVKSVRIEQGDKPAAGTVIGGAAGGVLGNTVGSGRGRTVATVAGALAGAAAGAAAEKKMKTADALEIIVNLDNGKTIVIVQEADVQLYPGDRIRVITSPDGTTRVSK
ncbi:MAG: glycine zipper 2TM domain-containing protein [Desulfobacterales bacterium]|nr:glycine zipper 2TM domain-containing protein [Desulfobacterales bacterium]